MVVILLKDIKGVGKKDQEVTVSEGYGKNFLLKNKLAVIKTLKANDVLKKELNVRMTNHNKRVEEANKIKDQIEKITLEFTLKENNGLVFGSISRKKIIDELFRLHKIKTNKQMFDGSYHESKYLIGTSNIKIKLIPNEVVANLKIIVNSENKKTH